MEKLQKYNQKLLAVLGTMALLFVGFMLIAGIFIFISEQVRQYNNNKVDDHSLRVEEVDTTDVDKPKLREQQITFGVPQLRDTLNAIYLIPVSQVNLEKPESVRNYKLRGLANSYGAKEDYNYYGELFNNLLIYNQKLQTKTKVFNKRAIISSFENEKIANESFILIEAATQDSNKDGKLNESDLKSFFVYQIGNNNLKEIGFAGMGLIDYNVLYKSSEIILRFGLDKDKNGEYENNTEPTVLKIVKLNEPKASDFLDEKLLKEIQNLID